MDCTPTIVTRRPPITPTSPRDYYDINHEPSTTCTFPQLRYKDGLLPACPTNSGCKPKTSSQSCTSSARPFLTHTKRSEFIPGVHKRKTFSKYKRPPKTILKTLKVRENIINRTFEDFQPQIRTSLSDINNKQRRATYKLRTRINT